MRAILLAALIVAAAAIVAAPAADADECFPADSGPRVCTYEGPYGPCFYASTGGRAICMGP